MAIARTYFGTDGIRGPHEGPVVNAAFFTRLGAAIGRWLQRIPDGSAPTVLIGRDTRQSGEVLEQAIAAGLRSVGAQPILLGVVPTPAVARAVHRAQAALAVVITASHNPASDNGAKLLGPDGRKLTDEDEQAIEALLPAAAPSSPAAALRPAPDAIGDYIAAAGQLLPAGALRGWKVVLDTANGATYRTSPAVLRQLGAEVIALGDQPNGANINAGVGSEHPEALAARVRASGARLGIAHDGDGDRCILCDERGDLLDGDEILTLLATHALAAGKLAARTLVATVHSNLGVDAAIQAAGGWVIRTAVGDRYVAEAMAASGATLGGESSGHIIFSEVSPTGDGLVAGLKVIEVMRATGQPLSALRRGLRKFPQASLALPVKTKVPLAQLPGLTVEIAALEKELGTAGRVLVRYSGTEAKLRLLVEGPSEAIVRAGLDRLVASARRELDA